MRILLDECVNPRLRAAFRGHEVATVRRWAVGGITNGKLMALAQNLFAVFVTLDRNLEYQQNLKLFEFGVIVVRVPDNKIASYKPLFAELVRAVETIRPGEVVRIPRES
jgi:hypothetical protein